MQYNEGQVVGSGRPLQMDERRFQSPSTERRLNQSA